MNILRLLIPVVLLVALHGAAVAQYPRMILIEEGTNASCDPCAWQSPVFEEFLEKPDVMRRVIPIVYHANWPGKDTMNLRAPEMHLGRIVGYYGWLGMPSAAVNGLTWRSRTSGLGKGVPADTAGLRFQIDSLRDEKTPVGISLADTIAGGAMRIATTVDLANMGVPEDSLDATLRIAIVERHHYYPYPSAGTNGEEHFHWIVRAMAPTHAGRGVVLAPGESARFDDTVALDPEWTRGELYVVAFVQNDSTREVLQAATTRRRVRFTYGDGQASGGVGGASTHALAPVAEADGPFVVGIETDVPEAWRIEVRSGDRVLRHGDTITLRAWEMGSLTYSLQRLSTGKGTVRISVTGERGATDTNEYRDYVLPLGIPVLALHGPKSPEVTANIEAAMRRGGRDFVMVNRGDEELLSLPDFPLVVVAAGDDTLTARHREILRDYLQKRGRLLISGSQIAQSLGDLEYDQTGIPRDTAFLHNYLHASYVAPTSATLAVNGLRDDPIGEDLGFQLGGGRREPGTPDRIRPRHNALAVFHYGSARDSIASLRYGRAEHRVVYHAFGLEWIADTADRAEVVERSIAWLLGSEITTGVEYDGSVASARVTPNPARTVVTVDAAGAGSVRIVDMLGAVRASVVVARGVQSTRLDVSMLKPGIYLVVVDGEARRAARLVIE